MFCAISFIFILLVVGQLESGSITTTQAIFYGAYGLLMFYYTSKPYWNYEEYEKNQKNKKNRRK